MKTINQNVLSYDLYTAKENMKEEIIEGLRKKKKTISSKYFYDQKGSELFESITQQEEYYPTRTEMEIFFEHHQSIAQCAGPVQTLIEYGSGSSRKIMALLHSFTFLKEYVPIDISKEFLLQSSLELADQFPHLTIKAVCGDYSLPVQLPLDEEGKKAIFFPGSTIGNFLPEEAKTFLSQSAQLLAKGDGFIIGVDMKKDRQTLESAYNDANGVTAHFNKNILERINRELMAEFDLMQFEHVAFFNDEKGRIEMHLKSRIEQNVQVAGEVFHFQKDETIHTENSYKYSIDEFQNLVRQAGFLPVKVWTDSSNKFSVHYLEKF